MLWENETIYGRTLVADTSIVVPERKCHRAKIGVSVSPRESCWQSEERLPSSQHWDGDTRMLSQVSLLAHCTAHCSNCEIRTKY